MEKHVFISYQHEDSEFGENLINRVEKAGFTTWIDNDRLHAGDDWRAKIDEAIKSSFALIVIMSPAAKASEYVTYEWAFAWGAGIPVIPILYEATPLHPRLEALQHLNFTNRTTRPWTDLFKAIEKFANHSPIVTSQSVVEDGPLSIANTQQQTVSMWLKTGDMFYERKDYQEALDAYRQAIRLDLNNASAYAGKSLALSQLKQFKEALIASDQAIILDATNALAWRSKGTALGNIERYEEALALYEQALRFDVKDAKSWYNKGVIFTRLNRYEEALVACEQSLRLDANYVKV